MQRFLTLFFVLGLIPGVCYDASIQIPNPSDPQPPEPDPINEYSLEGSLGSFSTTFVSSTLTYVPTITHKILTGNVGSYSNNFLSQSSLLTSKKIFVNTTSFTINFISAQFPLLHTKFLDTNAGSYEITLLPANLSTG